MKKIIIGLLIGLVVVFGFLKYKDSKNDSSNNNSGGTVIIGGSTTTNEVEVGELKSVSSFSVIHTTGANSFVQTFNANGVMVSNVGDNNSSLSGSNYIINAKTNSVSGENDTSFKLNSVEFTEGVGQVTYYKKLTFNKYFLEYCKNNGIVFGQNFKVSASAELEEEFSSTEIAKLLNCDNPKELSNLYGEYINDNGYNATLTLEVVITNGTDTSTYSVSYDCNLAIDYL